MATERIPPTGRSGADPGYTIRRIEGATYPLLPRTDEELAAMRAAHPDQAWFWSRTFYDEMLADQAEEEAGRAAGRSRTIYYSDEEFSAFLKESSSRRYLTPCRASSMTKTNSLKRD